MSGATAWAVLDIDDGLLRLAREAAPHLMVNRVSVTQLLTEQTKTQRGGNLSTLDSFDDEEIAVALADAEAATSEDASLTWANLDAKERNDRIDVVAKARVYLLGEPELGSEDDG